jgi:hypothetical protein
LKIYDETKSGKAPDLAVSPTRTAVCKPDSDETGREEMG